MMLIRVLGIDYHQTPDTVRSRMAITPDALPDTLSALYARRTHPEAELVVVSTCNRTEIITYAMEFSTILDFWNQEALAIPYCLEGEAAIMHIMRVACGLESMVLGESQIVKQLKEAQRIASACGTIKKNIQRLFQQAFMLSKQVRTHTGVGKHSLSISHLAVRLIEPLVEDMSRLLVLAIGAGDTMERCVEHLKKQGVSQISVANRTLAHAQNMAERFSIQSLSIEEIPSVLHGYDVVMAATGSAWPMVNVAMVKKALEKRGGKPMIFIDLSVPYNIDPSIAQLPAAHLYTIDDLKRCIDHHQELRHMAMKEAESYIRAHLKEFLAWKQEQEYIPTIRAYRQEMTEEAQKLYQALSQKLYRGSDPHEILRMFRDQILAKMTHKPTQWIKQGKKELLEEIRRSDPKKEEFYESEYME